VNEKHAEESCVIFGAGGHARVLMESLDLLNGIAVFCILDTDPDLWNTTIMQVEVLGGDDKLSEIVAAGVTRFVIGVGGIADNRPRKRLFELACQSGLLPLTIVDRSARISKSATIGAGSQLLPGSIVNAGTRIGANVIVNSGSIVEHDCRISDHVHIATGAVLASSVTVGQAAHIGAGAVVRQGIVIGEESVVGAGAVVVRDVAARSTVMGVPAHRGDVSARS